MKMNIRDRSARVMLLWLFAALCIGALAACAQTTAADIPTARDSQEPAPEAATPATQDPATADQTYSQCMREHGLSEFPDADAEGRIRIKLGTIDPDSALFREAGNACRELAPEGWGDTEQGPGDAEVMLAFARCMREHGLPDYPDPDPNAGLRIALDPNDPQAQTALESCKEILQNLQSGLRIGG